MGDKCDVCRDGFHLVAQGCLCKLILYTYSLIPRPPSRPGNGIFLLLSLHLSSPAPSLLYVPPSACPTCYDDIAAEFNATVTLYNELLEKVNRSGGLSPETIARLQRYQELLNALLERAINATNQEPGLLQEVESVSMETDALRGVVDLFETDVSSTENVADNLAEQVDFSEMQLRDLQELVGALNQSIRVTARQNLLEAQQLERELENEVYTLTAVINGYGVCCFCTCCYSVSNQ